MCLCCTVLGKSLYHCPTTSLDRPKMDPHQCPFARFRISSQHFALDLFVIGVIGTVTGSSIAIFWEPFWIFWSLATVYERWSAVWIERGRMATLWHQSLAFLIAFPRACVVPVELMTSCSVGGWYRTVHVRSSILLCTVLA